MSLTSESRSTRYRALLGRRCQSLVAGCPLGKVEVPYRPARNCRCRGAAGRQFPRVDCPRDVPCSVLWTSRSARADSKAALHCVPLARRPPCPAASSTSAAWAVAERPRRRSLREIVIASAESVSEASCSLTWSTVESGVLWHYRFAAATCADHCSARWLRLQSCSRCCQCSMRRLVAPEWLLPTRAARLCLALVTAESSARAARPGRYP